MKKSLIALAVAAGLSAPAFAEEAPASAHTFTGNVGFVSDYVFRGISQTQNKPAVQGGFDYSHASGVYVGVWGSNVNWVSENGYKDENSLEVDFYGGYRTTFAEDFGVDVGAIYYYYPGDRQPGFKNTNTAEVYAGVSWKFLSLKYNYVVSPYFVGWTTDSLGKTRGSGYLDLTASYAFGEGWGVVGHVGRQYVRGNGSASYTDWKLGVTKDVGIGVVGLAYTGTNADRSCPAADNYCWDGKDVAKGHAVLSFSKTF